MLLWENGFRYLVYFCIGMYGLMKILWFKIGWSLQKISFKSENSLYFLVIWWCFLYIVTSYSLDVYDAWKFSSLIYVWVAVVYFLWYSYFFTNLWDRILWRVDTLKSRERVSSRAIRGTSPSSNFLSRNVYPLMSVFTIILLMWFFYFQSLGKDSKIDTNILTENIFEQDLQNEIEAAQEWEVEPEFRVAIRKVSELYEFTNRLEVGNEWDEVQKLQWFLTSKWYYAWELDGIFDEETRVWLRDTLIGECGWPDTKFWVLGTQASVCINNMEVEYKIAINSEEQWEWEPELADNSSDEFSSEVAFSPDQLLTPEEAELAEEIEVVDNAPTELFIDDEWAWVVTLQNTLINLWYLASEADGVFDLTTSLALRSALIGQCGFSEDIEGNYDEAAIACIGTLTE